MADYWKSQPRHFCDFCKCWTADNKPSREFHEKGKRHQENVKKKLDELRKKGLSDAKQEKEMSGYLKQMEEAAMTKLKEDLKANPSLASQYGVIVKRKEPSQKAESVESVSDEQSAGEWVEAMTDEGYIYYWNTVTRESSWELPADAEITGKQTTTDADDELNKSPNAKKQKLCDSSTASISESTDGPKAITSVPPDLGISVADIELPPPVSVKRRAETDKGAAVASSSSPYGQWQQVKNESSDDQALIDLQLPVGSAKEQTIIVTEEPKIKFREKKLTSLSSGSSGFGSTSSTSISFRKPKAGVQRNIRTSDNAEET